MTPVAPALRSAGLHRVFIVTGAALLALVAWDFSGADITLTRGFGNAQGFAWRDHFLTAQVVHEGGRALAWATLIALLVCALRAPSVAPSQAASGGGQPLRQERLYWFAVTLACLLIVPTMKQFSSTSCPWDLAEFGGPAQLVSHWRWGTPDGGPGRCFPSGHAVGAFAFLSQYFLWRQHRPQRARAWLWVVLAVGCVFGLGQLARGAHHASHSAWSAWLCWAVCVLASAALAAQQRWQRGRKTGVQAAGLR